MDNVNSNTVIRQLLSFLPVDSRDRLLLDRYAKHLTITKAILVFVAAQLNHWSSYREIESHLRAQPEWQNLLGLPCISGAQLSRKLDRIPTEMLEWLFLQAVARLEQLSTRSSTTSARINKLRLVDSSTILLPLHMGDWARVSKSESSVKMHLRLVVASENMVFPDAMIPTTSSVNDRAISVDLVQESDAIYVMDRGYDKYKQMDNWVERDIRFVMRVRNRTFTETIETYSIPENTSLLRDAKVRVGATTSKMEKPVRLVEFQDEHGRLYRILTSVWDLPAEEIARIYKNRWLIELFFKWLKQHLRLVKLHSYKPQAIWNQMFLCLLTAVLVQCVHKTTEAGCSAWRFLQQLRVYMYHEWSEFEAELQRKPSRHSRGRQPTASTAGQVSLRTTVGVMGPSKAAKGNKKK